MLIVVLPQPQLDGDNILEERLITWRKHDIGDSLSKNYCISDIAVKFLRVFPNVKMRVFCCPLKREPVMVGKM